MRRALDLIASTGLWWSTQGDGSVEYTLRLPAEEAAAVIHGLDTEVELVKGEGSERHRPHGNVGGRRHDTRCTRFPAR